MNGNRIYVSRRKALANSIVVTDLTTKKDFHEDFFEVMKKISKAVLGIRVTHCTSLNLAHLAAARFDIYVKNKASFGDFVAGGCIIQEAGGKVTDFEGKKIHSEISDIIASNKELHGKLSKLIN